MNCNQNIAFSRSLSPVDQNMQMNNSFLISESIPFCGFDDVRGLRFANKVSRVAGLSPLHTL